MKTLTELVELGIIRSYDLQGKQGREEHDRRMSMVRGFNSAEERNLAIADENDASKTIPYNFEVLSEDVVEPIKRC